MFETLEGRTMMSASSLTPATHITDNTPAITVPISKPATVTPGTGVMLNPQPLPPRQTPSLELVRSGGRVFLNPQPLPP